MEMQEKNQIHMPPSLNVAVMNSNPTTVPQPVFCSKTPSGVPQNMSNISSLSKCINTNIETRNFSTPIINASDKKRKDSQTLNVSILAKKPRGRPPGKKNLVEGIILSWLVHLSSIC
ncbi:hypothetical protein CR513_20051, partial [Mucuna pruriens]